MFGDLYSMEADNDEIDVCMKSQVNNETAVTEAGTDTKAEDVSKIDTKTEAHNEQASTGGVATGSDSSDMEMDPVAATEAFCFKAFSMSAEDLANEVEDNIKVANAIPDADDAEAAADTSDPELEAVGMNNAGISTDDPAKVIPDETPADTAGITPDADESKDDGEEDADAPTNPIPPALPTSEEDWNFSEEEIEILSTEVMKMLQEDQSLEGKRKDKGLSLAESGNLGIKGYTYGSWIAKLIKSFHLLQLIGADATKFVVKSLAKQAGYTAAQLILGTIVENVISCGTFDDGADVLKSPKCLSKIEAFKHKHNSVKLTASELKNMPEVKSKSGFIKWLFLEQASGKNINGLDKVDVAIRDVDGVPVSVVQLTPFAGSVNLKQLAGYRVIVVTGYYKQKNGKVCAKHLCQAYITKGAKVNKSREDLSVESLTTNAPFMDFI